METGKGTETLRSEWRKILERPDSRATSDAVRMFVKTLLELIDAQDVFANTLKSSVVEQVRGET